MIDLNLEGLTREQKEELYLALSEQEERLVNNKIKQAFPDEGPLSRDKYPKHIEFFNRGADFFQRALMGGNRVGKAQPVYEKVLTPAGFQTIGSLQVGDQVIGSAGKPIRVLGVYPQGLRPTYELKFSDGSLVQSDEEHLWTFSYSGRDSFQTKSLKDWMKIEKSKYLPQRPEVEGEIAELPLEPYLLGLLIGDGSLTRVVGISSADVEIVDYCKAVANGYNCELKYRSQYDYGFSSKIRSPEGYGKNELLDIVRALGLNCKSDYKFIPTEYLLAHKSQRLELLQGLMDTDGYISVPGRGFYNTVSEKLAEDVLYLARSLGINARKKRKQVGFEVYLPYFSKPLAKLTRKAERQAQVDTSQKVTLQDVKYIGEKECVCIEVDAPDSLYLTSDFVLTHNTYAGCFEMVCHLTGNYPEWWKGRRFDGPINAWACGKDNNTTRDVLQANLLGPYGMEGTGLIPKHLIAETSAKPGIPKAISDVWVPHVSGGMSHLTFKSYEQEVKSFMGTAMHVIWLDEEPPKDIYTECVMRLVTTKGILYATFTPLFGFTDVVMSFMKDGKFPDEEWMRAQNKFITRIEWDDAPHIMGDEDAKKMFGTALTAIDQDMRMKGIPSVGEGKIYPISEDHFVINSIELSPHWPRAYGLDVGYHRTAAIFGAYDTKTDIWYLYDEHYMGREEPAAHSAHIRTKGGKWMPGAIDPSAAGAGSQRDGIGLLEQYRDHDLDLYLANNSVDLGIRAVHDRLATGRLKVFSNCQNWLQEFRIYSRDKNGGIRKSNDHLMDATRYLIMTGTQIARVQPDLDDEEFGNPSATSYYEGTRNETTGY